MIRGKSFKLLVISTMMTHKETVIRIEPPRKEAAPNKAYLETQQNGHNTFHNEEKQTSSSCSQMEGKGLIANSIQQENFVCLF